ncbi:hypothetical protein Xen7305DRAFT_00049820 [Xenococcus sp. PCC 7305]|uniref:Na-translocating system protein MpsC family protein n=1 Tax=Xenococcus sp. PCC 7305 TaxID=102125 RepID=UPI0002AC17F1|nr:Na-translocating system protein MpsC family protein [Xenococcus sp. PCC 7305]ELS05239.1 hypothetical protein Xen7305DRAFT_00049820 [Xenococcus sp. PCC 7305]
MNKKVIRTKEIENLLSQKIRDAYQDRLEHKLDKVSYKLFDHTLVVMLEGITTSPEKVLRNNDRIYLANQVREVIDNVMQSQIQEIIEEVFDIKVVDFLSDTTIDNNLTGAIAIFEFKPNSI